MIPAGVKSRIFQLRGEEEMRAGQLGTTTYGGDLKDWVGDQAEGAKHQYK